MNNIKNMISNTPLVLAGVLQYISQLLINMSIRLHIGLKTKVGIQFVETRDRLLRMAAESKAKQAARSKEESRLTDLANETQEEVESLEGVIKLDKRRTENKN